MRSFVPFPLRAPAVAGSNFVFNYTCFSDFQCVSALLRTRFLSLSPSAPANARQVNATDGGTWPLAWRRMKLFSIVSRWVHYGMSADLNFHLIDYREWLPLPHHCGFRKFIYKYVNRLPLSGRRSAQGSVNERIMLCVRNGFQSALLPARFAWNETERGRENIEITDRKSQIIIISR